MPAGYTGESVKSRAATLGDEAKTLVLAQRQALLVALGTLDRATYNVQMGKAKADAVTTAAISACADEAVIALDAILAALARE
jgi:hypothetical protein